MSTSLPDCWERLWEEETQKEVDSFLDGAATIAHVVRMLTKDRDSVDGSAVMDFIAMHGLDSNIEAAKIVQREYRRFVRNLSVYAADDAVELLIGFYADLEKDFSEKGVKVWKIIQRK